MLHVHCTFILHVHVYVYTLHVHVHVYTELQALAEVVGPYGIQFLGERLMEQVSAQVKEIRKLVENNQDTLLALHTNRDKPEVFNELLRRLKSKNYIYINVLDMDVDVDR